MVEIGSPARIGFTGGGGIGIEETGRIPPVPRRFGHPVVSALEQFPERLGLFAPAGKRHFIPMTAIGSSKPEREGEEAFASCCARSASRLGGRLAILFDTSSDIFTSFQLRGYPAAHFFLG